MISRSVVACVAALALAGCGTASSADSGPSGAPTAEPQIEVLAAFYPYWFVAQRVGGPRVNVGLLTDPGVEPHDLELSPRQVAGVGEVDLVIYQQGFQPAVDETVAQQAPDKQLEINAALGRTPGAEEHGEHEGESAEEHAAHEAEAVDEHGHPIGDLAADPHVWLDTDLLARVTTVTADAFSRIDPAGSTEYQQRAAQLRNDLAALDGEYKAGLQSCARRDVIVNHAAFGHLTHRYSLEQVGINGLSPDAAPSPQHLAEIAEQIRTEGATTVYTESLASPRLAETLAREAGVTTATLDPLEGLARDDSRDFLSVMRDNLAALRTGLGCTTSTPTPLVSP